MIINEILKSINLFKIFRRHNKIKINKIKALNENIYKILVI